MGRSSVSKEGPYGIERQDDIQGLWGAEMTRPH